MATPGNPDADYILSLKRKTHHQLFQWQDYDSASRTLDELRILAPSDPLTHGLQGHLLLARNQIKEGLASLQRAVQLAPDDYDACLEYGIVLYDYGATCGVENSIANALSHLRKASAAAPQEPEPHTYIGLCLHRQGDLLAATEAYRTSLALASRENGEEDEGKGFAYLCLGDALSALGHWQEAIAAYRQALQRQPNLIEATEGLAVAYYHEGFLIRAYDIFQKLLPSSQSKNRIIEYLKRIFSEGGHYSEAAARYRSAGVKSSTAILWMRLGTTLFRKGFSSEALSAFYEGARRENPPDNVYNQLHELLSMETEVAYQEVLEQIETQQKIRQNELEQIFGS